jgi:hypothetical protein
MDHKNTESQQSKVEPEMARGRVKMEGRKIKESWMNLKMYLRILTNLEDALTSS